MREDIIALAEELKLRSELEGNYKQPLDIWIKTAIGMLGYKTQD